MTLTSRSWAETLRAGQALGRVLEPGCVVGLIGELGAGKTCFAKGVASAATGVAADEVTSPTFTIVQEYEGPVLLYHVDAYRLAGPDDLQTIGFDDYLDGSGITIIEWADRISAALPGDCLLAVIHIVNEHERQFTFSASGQRHTAVLARLRASLAGGARQ